MKTENILRSNRYLFLQNFPFDHSLKSGEIIKKWSFLELVPVLNIAKRPSYFFENGPLNQIVFISLKF